MAVGVEHARRSLRLSTLGLIAFVLACSEGLPPDPPRGGEPPPESLVHDGLLYRLRVERIGESLEGTLTATNVSGARIRRDVAGGCMTRRVVYRQGAWFAPVWEWFDQANRFCYSNAVVLDLAPGEAATSWSFDIDPLDVLGDSLSSGAYRVAARLLPAGEVVGEIMAPRVVRLDR